MTDAAKDYKCSPCGEYRFFLYDPNDGITFWKTEEDRDKAAETAIDSYLDEEWNEEVLGVVAGVVTHLTVEIDRVDKIGKLDDDGYDEAGEYWPNNDCDYKCNHALKPLDTPPPRRTMELTDKEIMDAMPKQLHEDLANVCKMASDSLDEAKVAGMFRVCLNRGIVDHCRTAIAADRAANTPSFLLVWTENRPPCEDCRYDHCIAETPFGRFLVTWKGWKEHDSPTVDETPWGDRYEVFDSVDEAKAACQLAMSMRLALCLQPTPSPSSNETR